VFHEVTQRSVHCTGNESPEAPNGSARAGEGSARQEFTVSSLQMRNLSPRALKRARGLRVSVRAKREESRSERGDKRERAQRARER